ncbi:glycosyltransferase family 4 protein [Archaeoglobus sp.]
MRICIVVPYFTSFVKGNEYGLAESLLKLGNDVTIITSTSRAPREKDIINKHINKKYSFEVIYLRTITDVFENPIVIADFNKLMSRFDVVMLQEDYPSICHFAFFAAKMHNITTVLSSERTYIPLDVKKRFGLYIFDHTVSKLLREKCDIFTVHCTAAKHFLKNVIGVRRDVEVVHVGVDCKLFKPINEPENLINFGNEDLRILTVARYHKYKGLDYLIMAMKDVIYNVNAKLYLLGKGEEESRLRMLAKDLGVSDYVKFVTTPIPNENMPHVYSQCDIYVQPSVIEPYGIAVLEAMACGKPVVGTNVGGMLDTIEHGKSGFRTEPANPKELAKYIIKLSDNKLRKKMSRNARKRAKLFDWIKIGKKYIKLIKKC